MYIIKKNIIILLITLSTILSAESNLISTDKQQTIESFINSNMEYGKIPGISVVIIHNDKTEYQKDFGYSDLKEQRLVTNKNIFELGSTSKAFTGLGILLLEEMEQLNLEDNVSNYIKDFYVEFKSAKVDIKIKHLLNHTSGIPYNTIEQISKNDKSMKDSIDKIIGVELNHKPGEAYLYATINYDILGLIIEKVSGLTFEQYIDQKILKPLNLNNTYIGYQDNYNNKELSKGHKLGYLTPKEYQAPEYIGNIPAGYFISGSEDIAKWLKAQINSIEVAPEISRAINKSHIPNNSVDPDFDNTYYGAGWHISVEDTNIISHSGNNPNFSSHFIIDINNKYGVAVLANLNTSYTTTIANGIMNIINDKDTELGYGDMYQGIDFISFIIFLISFILILLMIIFITLQLIAVYKGNKTFISIEIKSLIPSAIVLIFLGAFFYFLFNIPNILFGGLSWSFIHVWAPFNFILSFRLFYTAVFLICLNAQLRKYFKA